MTKRILLADDSITIQKVVELTFSDGDYEVTAVNNGAKAIQKLSEMRPDIILSDIIMPEKNGYEVCEYVKSHPEFRNIPVVLLTGTFEPFDPDRADKAGCDAVVTKPFESQSLIHKVEELIEQARSQAPTAPTEAVAVHEPSPSDAFATGAFEPRGEVFSGPQPALSATTETPFAQPPPEGETRAFPSMSFDDLKKAAAVAPAAAAAPPPPPPPPTPEPASPWDEPAPAGGETRAFPSMSFEDLKKAAAVAPIATPPPPPPPPPAAPAPEPISPWDEPAASGGETRAFPRMSFDDLSKLAESAPPPPPPPPIQAAPEPPSWGSSPAAAEASLPFEPPAPPPMPPAEPAPWTDQTPEFAGETKAFPRMSFDDLEKLASPAPPAPQPAEPPSFMMESEAAAPAPPPVREVLFVREPEPPPAAPAAQHQAVSAASGDLTDEQVDRIARRVVELMSEQVIRNIAWEVIPDLAETVVKERIRQLESE